MNIQQKQATRQELVDLGYLLHVKLRKICKARLEYDFDLNESSYLEIKLISKSITYAEMLEQLGRLVKKSQASDRVFKVKLCQTFQQPNWSFSLRKRTLLPRQLTDGKTTWYIYQDNQFSEYLPV